MFIEKTIGTIFIAVMGVEQGSGATHTSILIAHYLNRKGYKVAIVEANRKEDFARIEGAYEGEDPSILNNESFKLKGVSYYKSSFDFAVADLMEQKYDYILLDLGSNSNYFIEEFYRSHLQIIVGHGSEWRQHKLIEFSEEHIDRDQSNWIFCVPFVKPIVIEDIEKEIVGGQIYQIPIHPDPYEIQKNTDVALYGFLKGYMERKKGKTTRLLSILLGIALIIILLLIFLLVKK